VALLHDVARLQLVRHRHRRPVEGHEVARGAHEEAPHLGLAGERAEPLRDRVDGLELRVELLARQRRARAADGVGGEVGERVEERGLVAGQRLHLEPLRHEQPRDDAGGPHGQGEERPHPRLLAVPRQVVEEPLEVGRVERRAALEHEREGIAARGDDRVRDEARRAPGGPQVRLLAGAVDVEVEDGVGAERRVRHPYEPRQVFAELRRAVELARAAPFFRDLAERRRRRRGPHGARPGVDVVELVDVVLEPRELGERRGETALLAGERAVDGNHDRGVRERGRERGLPARARHPQERRRGEDGGEPGDGEGHGPALRDRERGHEHHQERPDRPPERREELPERVEREGEEAVEGERLRPTPPPKRRQERGRGDAHAQRPEVRELQPGRDGRGERPQQRDERQEAGEAEGDLARLPADTDVEDGILAEDGLDGDGQADRSSRPSTSA
jgi:hypothetical protein